MEVYFFELGVIMIVVSIIGVLFRLVKQPLILAYIFTGFVLGPMFFKVVANQELIRTFSTIGVTFLLFLIGLELDVRKLKNIGKTSIIVSLGHFVITGILGFTIATIFKFPLIPSLYIALALTLSSTVIVVKLLSEKNDLNSLYGKIGIGFLIVQDVIAVMALVFLDSFKDGNAISFYPVFAIFIKALVLILGAFLVSSFILPRIFRYIAKQQELLFIISIAWCFLFAILAHYLGLSVEIGAFLAGFSLAYLPYSYEIVARVKSLRDFFLIIFFVALGTQVSFSFISHLGAVIAFSLFVLLIQPIIVMVILGLLGYRKRTSFLAGISIAQISEFSLVILGVGFALGHISAETVSILTVVGILTITISTYFITYSEKLYVYFRDYLSFFERKKNIEHYTPVEIKIGKHVVVVGCHTMGSRIIETLRSMKKNVLIVDFDPDIICNLNNRKIPCIYGDIEDEDIIEKIELDKASMVISTIPSLNDNLLLIRRTKKVNSKAVVIVATDEPIEAFDLYRAGADYVILPYVLGGEHSSLIIRKIDKDKRHLKKLKKSHIKHLEKKRVLYSL